MDGGQGAAARPLLRLGVARAVGALGPGEDAALGEEEDLAIRELLLKLSREARKNTGESDAVQDTDEVALGCLGPGSFSPLLDFVETHEERNWDEYDNCLLAMADLELGVKSATSGCLQRLHLGRLKHALTSFALTNCRGRRALLMSAVLVSRS